MYVIAAVGASLLLAAVGLPFSLGHAQVTSSGLGTTVNQPGTGVFNITGGTRPNNGPNLFHSFGNFSLNTPESANFLNNSGLPTTNILSRVTGGNPSSIFGTINTLDFPAANLFLMNPAGIIFGPTAQLNVSGSFHATTADYIKLGSDGIFYADPARPTVLSIAPPSAFGFLTANPASIEVQTGGIDPDTFLPTALLQVPEGQTLSLVGGNAPGSDNFGVSIGALDGSTPGYVLAPAGRVNLVSVASAGEAAFDGKGFNVDGFTQLGGVKVGPGSIVDGKEIFVRSGRLVIEDGVLLPGAFAAELSFVGLSPLPDGGEVNIKVTNDVTITGTDFEPLTFAPPGIFAYSGDAFSISPEAKVPDVNIDAGSLSISGFAAIQTRRNAPGSPGNVVINANTVNIGSGGSVSLFNTFEGPGGNLIINAKDVNVLGDGSLSPNGFEGLAAQGVASFAFFPPDSTDPRLITADSGNITINASNSLNVTGLGQITTDSRVFGRAGAITINAGDISLAGTGQFESGAIASQSAFAGDAGNVTINAANTITVKDGFRISSTSLGSGNAGNVDVTAGKSITLSNSGRILGRTNQPPDAVLNALLIETFFQDLADLRAEMGNPNATMMEIMAYLQVRGDIQIPDLDLTPGDAGTVSVTTPALTLSADASIQTSTGWEGNAGQIVGNVASLSIDGGSFISSSSGIVLRNPDGTIIGPVVGPGNAGSITLTASDTIAVSESNSVISTATFGDGNAGSVSLSANRIDVQNSGSVTSASGGTLADQFFVGAGNAGQISVSTPTLTMADGTISVATSGAGSAGSILLNGNTLSLTGGSQVVSSTTGSGQGGSVAATAGESILISGSGSGLLSTASSTGNAGQITVSTPTLTMGESGTISVATTSAGNAGNISLNVSNFTQTGGARVESSTTSSGQGGNVTVTASESASLSGLASGLFSTTSSTGNAGQITVTAPGLAPVPTLNMADGGTISVATSGAGSAGSILLNANTLSLAGGAQVLSSTSNIGNAGSISLNVSEFTQTGGSRVESSTSGAGAGGTLELTASELVSMSGTGSGLFSTAQSTGNAGQITVTAPGSAPVPTLAMADGGKISVETSGAGSAGSILLNANNFSLAGGAQVVSSTSGAGQGGSVTLRATESASFSGLGSGLLSTASSTGNAGEVTVSTPTLAMANGGTISVATSNIGNAGSISLNVSEFTQTGGSRVESSTSGAGAGGTLGLTASELVSISGTGSGLFSTAESTGNAGQVTVAAPRSTPVPTLSIADGGKISVETLGAGSAGSILLNANTFSLTGGAQVVSNTTGAGQGGSVTATATESASFSGLDSGLLSTASSTGNAGQITVSTPTLAMADGGTISVATSNIGNAGSISLNVSKFTQTGGSRVESSTSGAGAGGTLGLTASELVSISGTGSGLFSTAESTGNAGQVTVAAPGSTPVPTLAIADGGKISVETLGAGNAGSILLNANTFSLTGGAQVESNTTGAGQGGSVRATAGESVSISGSGSLPSGLFSTASSTGNAGEVTVSTPTLAMASGGTISVATSGAGNAGNVSLKVSNFNLTGGAQIVSSTSGAGQGGSVSANATTSASISGQGTGMFSNASGSGAGGTINLQAGQLQITDLGVISANSTGTATATAGNVNIVAGELVQMQNGSVTTESTLADGGNISITTTGSMVRLNDSRITTSVQSGVGSGGNITIGSEFILFNNSEIRADAFGGPGGNITIIAETFLPSNSVVSASSALSTPGTIAIEATFTDVTGSFVQLPSTPLEATELLRASCAARFAGGKASSLVVGGRDGVPLQPGNLLPSPLYVADPSTAPKSITQETPLRFTLLGSKDRLSNQYSLLPNAKCSL